MWHGVGHGYAPILGGGLVVVAAAASVARMAYVYRRERHRGPSRQLLIVVAIWFLISYGFMAFVIQPL